MNTQVNTRDTLGDFKNLMRFGKLQSGFCVSPQPDWVLKKAFPNAIFYVKLRNKITICVWKI